MQPVRKAVILAAGYGTRMLPVTKSQPKEMLPLVDKPVIHYAVEEVLASGIDQIVIVTAIGKRAVEDYFDRSRDVEDLLAKKGDTARLKQILEISQMANIAYVRQGEARGLADAVSTARHLVEDEPFVLVLPDDVIVDGTPATKQLIDCYYEHHGGVVAVEEVPESEVSSYGIVEGETIDDHVTRLRRMVEKPPVHEAPSRLAIVGRYLLTPAVWSAIDRIVPGYGGELQITDALQIVAAEEGMYAYRFEGTRYDTGRPLSLLRASIELALRRSDVGPELRTYLRNLDLGDD
ncbi:MAG TPA: UTP--glucose-1-phosphate uridylyltransferase GalU [Dehalococcoidia bacterium]|nr:UTP--glucose-1-phosphate uridylyltransferase GalU [Dehalococcoidia bacterium]